MSTTLLPRIELESAPNPTAAVIWMHGLGADGNDFAPLAPQLDLAGCQPIRFIFPHAPSMPVSINNGYVMPAWYDILVMDLVRQEDGAGIRKSALAIEALIANEVARGIQPANIVLAGFSQGGAVALYTGLRHPERIAGVVALSTYLVDGAGLPAEASAANRDLPLFMAHGTFDPVVRIAWAEQSRDALAAMGWSVEWHAYPMEHAATIEEIAAVGEFLRRVLPV